LARIWWASFLLIPKLSFGKFQYILLLLIFITNYYFFISSTNLKFTLAIIASKPLKTVENLASFVEFSIFAIYDF